MSEHTYIKGRCCYAHLPYRKEGFTWCRHCKDFADKVEIQFNEGWFNDWMRVKCCGCEKTIWVCSFKHEQDMQNKEDDSGVRRFPKDDKRCFICKKKTNHFDCYCILSCCYKSKTFKEHHLCSKKCESKFENKQRKWLKSQKQS